MTGWLDDPGAWDRLADRLVATGEAGIDSETYGQPDRTSPQFRARVHSWSVAVASGEPGPRGYPAAFGVALPRAALWHAPLHAALQSIRLWGHNAPHDIHSFANEGLLLHIDDTLQWLRVAVPGMAEYGLKAARRWALGKPARPELGDLWSYRKSVTRTTLRTETRCDCGAVPCRRQSKTLFYDPVTDEYRPHSRRDVRIPTEHVSEVDARYTIPDFHPGAVMVPGTWNGRPLDRMAAWWDYVVQDAVDAIQLRHWLETAGTRGPMARRFYPWRRK